ncbi:MAG: ATP-binding protein [Anaerolineae bacterium]|nr:ATP-binding protein [Anaerolineae bacterium]
MSDIYNSLPVGRVKGPGPTSHSFSFVAFARPQALKVGEFVVCPVELAGVEQPLLARVVQSLPLRLLPHTFLSAPTLLPADIAAVIGYAGQGNQTLEVVAEIIGYFDLDMNDFINPRILPPAGQLVRLASDALLTHLLNHFPPGQVGAATVGSLLSRSQEAVPLVLDVAALASTHLAIIASTGAGKSYLASVLIEEMLGPHNRAAIMLIDPHGEYGSLAKLPAHPQMQTEAYQPQVTIHKPGQLKIRLGSLSLTDLQYLLPNLSERMEYVLGQAYRQVSRRQRQQWTLADLRQAIQEIGEPTAGQKGTSYRETARAVLWRLNAVLADSLLFDDTASLHLNQLIRPGQCTILQLNEVSQRQQQVLVATLLRQLFQARLQTSRQQVSSHSPLYLPYPVFVLIEEAHHFAPANGEAISGGILKQILGEGRKFGVGVGLISQRPGKLDADVLSQCNTQCLLRIVNPNDQAKVRESVESVGQDFLRELPALSKGQAIIAGAAVNTPVLCRVRRRHTPHIAEDISAPQVWRNYQENS